MTITVTEKKSMSHIVCAEPSGAELEAATDEGYIAAAETHIKALYDVMEKYKKAREKANYFQMVRAEVSRRNRNRGLRPRDIDALTRKLIKKM